jgi:hypothetical protein
MASDDKRLVRAKLARWIGRVWSIPAILVTGINILFPDSSPGAKVYWYEWLALGFLFSSVLALIVGWWKEKIGGWAALGLLILFFVAYGIYAQEFFPAWYIILAGIALPAGLFLVSDFLRI